MLTIPIKIRFSKEFEIKRAKETLDSLPWLIENGYRFSLPQNVEAKDFENTEKIANAVANEYDVEPYKVAENAIMQSWEKNNSFVNKINQKMVGSYILKEVNIFLTKYGTQGSYLVPNSMIVNISSIPPEFLIKTVIHESVHLMVNSLIENNSVKHWAKERLVDLIVDLEYKSRFKMQPVPDWALATDDIFKEDYPDVVVISEKLSKISVDK